jgi:hypothetical protein
MVTFGTPVALLKCVAGYTRANPKKEEGKNK